MDRTPEQIDANNSEIGQQNRDEDLSRDQQSNRPNRNFQMKPNALQLSSQENQQQEKIQRFTNRDQRLDQSISPIRYQDNFGAPDNESDINEDESLMRDIQLLEICESNFEQSLLNQAFIEKSLQEQLTSNDQQDQSNIIKKSRSYAPLFLPEHINRYSLYLEYTKIDEKILIQSKFSNFIFITPKEVKGDEQNNYQNIRDKILDFQIQNQVVPNKPKQTQSEQLYLLQYRVNKTYPYYFLNKVVYFHGLHQLFRVSKDYKFRGFSCQNNNYFDVELDNFTLQLGQALVELINATDSKVNLDYLSYESILQLLKWAIKYTIMYPRYILLSYLIPQLKVKDIIYLFNWSLRECDYFEKQFHQALQAYLSIYIGDNFDEFMFEFHNGQIADQLLNLSIDKVHKLFYYSLICCRKDTRNKILNFISEQFYKLNQVQLLEKLSQEFDTSFTYFRSIPRGQLDPDYSNSSCIATFCKGKYFRLESDYHTQNREKDENYFISNSQQCTIEIDLIEPNSILFTNSVITATYCWKVILITDSDLNISIFIYNQGFARFYQYMDQNQKQINQDFIQMAQKSDNSFVVLHSKIQINDDSYQFCHSYCINQKQQIGLCNIKKLKQEYSIKVTLTEIPFIASLLSNNLENFQNLNLNLQYKMAILHSDKLDILNERELLQYIESIWESIPDDQRKLYVLTLRLDLIDQKDLITRYNDLNQFIIEIKQYRVLNQDSRINQRQKSKDIYTNQENCRQITNLTKTLNSLTLNDKQQLE